MKNFFAEGKNIYIPRLDSTNKEMFRVLEKNSLPEGTIIWTDEQYNGKGLANNSWDALPGLNVTASFLLYPDFIKPENQFYLNKIISLAVCETISGILKEKHSIKIKWSNDIMITGKKIAGILIENTIQGSYIEHAVCGIGINVNQTSFKDYQQPPTSIKLFTGKSYDIKTCIEKLTHCLAQRYNQLKEGLLQQIDEEYLNRLFLYCEKASYKSGDKVFDATIIGVDKYGRLMLKLPCGKVNTYGFKEIQFIN